MRKFHPAPMPAMIVLACALVASAACMDREPAPVCPVPTELVATSAMWSGYRAVDLAVVVDNSLSMA